MFIVVQSRKLQSSRKCGMFLQKSDFTNHIILLVLFLHQIYAESSQSQQKPTITLNPWLDAVVKGENIGINCTIGSPCSEGWFYLYKNEQKRYDDKIRTSDGQCTATFEIRGNFSENYTCGYVPRYSGKWGELLRSDPIFVRVIDRPKAPDIILKSQFAKFITGEAVEIICQSSVNYSCGSMYFLKHGEQLFNQTVETNYYHRFSMFRMRVNASGCYTCQCALLVSGEWLVSEPSDSLNITVINQPTKPILSRNQTAEVFIEGELVQLTCTVDFQAEATTFYLYNSRRESCANQSHVGKDRHIVTFKIAPVRKDYFTCVCGAYVSGQLRYSEESERVNFTVIDRPRKPEISVNWTGSAFLQGENIRLTCKSEGPYGAQKFVWYKGNNRQLLESIHVNAMHNLAIIDRLANQPEDYKCAYQVNISGRLIDSENSTTLHVPVIKPPAKAEISLNRNFSVYIGGELLSLTCKTPDQGSKGTFFIYSLNPRFPVAAIEVPKGSQTVTFNVTTMMNSGVESYQCIYKAIVAGRVIESEPSVPLILTIKERPPKPTITMDLQGPITEEGQNITVNCTAPNAYAPEKFYLYLHSEEQPYKHTETEGGHSAAFNIMVPLLKMSKEYYTCQYQVQMAGRSIASALSDPQMLPKSDGQFWYYILGSFLLVVICLVSFLVAIKNREAYCGRARIVGDNLNDISVR
ncbi:uncharacterized protein LOC127587585 [Pristis pectinata]|uniref:uncharacterized protein LOC127587585 n=1 Tax=Pristis pectinata TaxID=685728 RepID=UPI00223E32DA|nr:uncharacterized protein LOC127587585 [Pristis pectinata]